MGGRSDLGRALKRLVDVLGSAAGLAVLGVPMAVVAVLIRLRMGPPVVFKQQRPGLHGKLFDLYKFRTMKNPPEEENRALPDRERLTPLGVVLRRCSLDELPELANVLLGDMSLVGPRPLLPHYLPLYSREQARRHAMRPGITGWAQVNGRNALSWEEKFELDVWYVDNWSLGLDLRIMLMTLGQVIRGRGISAEDHATMPEFRGHDPGQADR